MPPTVSRFLKEYIFRAPRSKRTALRVTYKCNMLSRIKKPTLSLRVSCLGKALLISSLMYKAF